MTTRDVPPDANRFPELVALALDAFDRGGDTELEIFLQQHVEDEAALRERLAALRISGFLTEPNTERLPDRIGPFRILRRLGAGAMGMVYLAEQEGLGRQVAIKLIRHEQLFDTGTHDRFRREVEALARMHHPGIVAVFSGGKEGDAPYLVMEWVHGATLHEILAELSGRPPDSLRAADLARALTTVMERREPRPATSKGRAARHLFSGTWVAAVLQIVRDVAEALQHAHERGVLHRDVKPSNVMITPEGRVLLLDFGLARAEGAARLTQTGAQLGSPAYMSPEQIRGDQATVDARTDVYSLGVMLYELLTLRPPFVADSIETTCAAVLRGDPVSPRLLNVSAPRDSETVCLKAMDRDAELRYARAADFAEDVGNILDLRPIHARRPPLAHRLVRWWQRRPATAVAAVAATLFVIGGPTIWFVQEQRSNRDVRVALAQKTIALEQVRRERDRTREAIDLLLTEVAQEQLLSVPRMQPLRHRLLENALRFEEQLLGDASDADRHELEFETIEAAIRVARLRSELGHSERALDAIATGEKVARAMLTNSPATTPRATIGRLLTTKGAALLVIGRPREALSAIDEALALFAPDPSGVSPLSEESDDSNEFDIDRQQSMRYRAVILGRLGRSDESIEAHRACIAFLEETSRWRNADLALCADLRREVLANRMSLASLLVDLGRIDEVMEVAQLPALLGAEESDDDDLATEMLRLGLGGQLATALVRSGRFAESRQALDQPLLRLEALLRDFPEASQGLRLRASMLCDLAMVCEHEQDIEGARDCYHRSIADLRAILALDPASADARRNLAVTLSNLGSADLSAGDPTAARAKFEEAAREAEDLPIDPARLGSETPLFNALWYLAIACRDLGDHRAASAAATRLPDVCPTEPRAGRIAAGIVAQCQPLIADDDELEEDERRQLLESGRDLALSLLRRAVAAGCVDADRVETGDEFHALRSCPEIVDLIDGLRQNGSSSP